MARALYDARRAGLKVTGYAADRRDYGRVMPRLRVREAAARVKTHRRRRHRRRSPLPRPRDPHHRGRPAVVGIDSPSQYRLWSHVSTLQATDHEHLARAIELAEGGRGRTSPNPLVGAVIVRDGRVLGEGFHAELGGPHAERAAIAAVRRTTCAARRCTSRWSRAATPAARRRAPRRSSRPASRASSSPPTTRPRRPPAAASGILRDEGIEVVLADGELAAPRAAAQPAVPQARAHRPAVGALQVGDDARRQGRDPHRRLQVDLGRGLAPALAPLARRGRRGRRRDRHRADRRPAADRPDRGRQAPAAPDRLRLRGPPAAGLPARARRRRGAADRRRHPRRAAHRGRRAGDRRRRVIVATGANEPDRVRNALVQLGRARASPRSCSRAARTSRARSWTPARSTRSACSSRRSCSAARARATRWRARAPSASPPPCARCRWTARASADDVLITARMREW